MLDEWPAADSKGERLFPARIHYRILLAGKLKQYYQIDPKDCWVLAAAQKNLPIFVPGWEDSTLGNMFASHVISGDIKNVHTVRTGIEYMANSPVGTQATCRKHSIGFFQIGGGIAGDFPICVVPMLEQDLKIHRYSALGLLLPDQRFDDELRLVLGRRSKREDHMGKARRDTPKFIIESDATIVAPLIFAYVLGQ